MPKSTRLLICCVTGLRHNYKGCVFFILAFTGVGRALDPHRLAVAHASLRHHGNTLYLTHHRNSDVSLRVDVAENCFYVKHPGYYFIYSQVTFTYRAMTSGAGVQGHYVYRHSDVLPNDGNELLLRNSKTLNSQGALFTETTSFTAGIHLLRAGDCVFVNVSDVTAVSHNPDTSFLGLHGV